ncbi:hypothetical protein [Trueperella pyogenes]
MHSARNVVLQPFNSDVFHDLSSSLVDIYDSRLTETVFRILN